MGLGSVRGGVGEPGSRHRVEVCLRVSILDLALIHPKLGVFGLSA